MDPWKNVAPAELGEAEDSPFISEIGETSAGIWPTEAQRWGDFESPFVATAEHYQSLDAELDMQVEEADALEETEPTGWSGTPEQISFRDRVLQAHTEASRKRKGAPIADLADKDLVPVRGTGICMRRDAAGAAERLLSAARAALVEAQRTGHADALKTLAIGAASGYRNRAHQERLWRGYFDGSMRKPKGYYDETAPVRATLPGGEHGDVAVRYMLRTFCIPDRIAAPGYSNHQAGLAIDLLQKRIKGERVFNSTSKRSVKRWEASWLFEWLLANAGFYGFERYRKEPWHWTFRSTDAESTDEAWTYEDEVGHPRRQPHPSTLEAPTSDAELDSEGRDDGESEQALQGEVGWASVEAWSPEAEGLPPSWPEHELEDGLTGDGPFVGTYGGPVVITPRVFDSQGHLSEQRDALQQVHPSGTVGGTSYAHMAFPHILLETLDPATSAMVPAVVPATPAALTTPFYDATVPGTTSDDNLREALSKLLNDRPAYRNTGRNLAVSLVDLSGANRFSPKYAGFNDLTNFYGASVAKVTGLLGVYQLLAEVNELLKAQPTIADSADLGSALTTHWSQAGIVAKHHPLVASILAVQPGSPPTATIRPELLVCLDGLSHGNQNGSTPIVLLRFPFIGSTMLAHGLFSPQNRGGLWVRGAYGPISYSGRRFSLPRWSPRENPYPNIGYEHNVNAVSVAQFYTLAAQSRMIDAATSRAVLRHLGSGGCTTEIDVSSMRASGQVSTKCGIYRGWVHNSVHFKETATLREFVIVILTRDNAWGITRQLFRDLAALVP